MSPVWDSVECSVSDLKLEFRSPTLEGKHNAGFLSYYQYIRQ